MRLRAHSLPLFTSAVVANLSLMLSLSAVNAQARSDSTLFEADRQQLLRTISFGNRELNLPLQLSNAELQVKNDQLAIDIAKLECGAPDTDRLQIDKYLLEEARKAVTLAKTFAQVWSKSGTPSTQAELSDFDNGFDEAERKCNAHDEENHKVVFESLEMAKTACGGLDDIYVGVQSRKIAVSIGWPSVFKNDPQAKTRLGYSYLKEDLSLMRSDQTSHIDPKRKKQLLRLDEMMLSQDKGIWLVEISYQETIAFNAKYPDHPMADAAQLLTMLKTFRQKLSKDSEDFRKSVSDNTHHAAH